MTAATPADDFRPPIDAYFTAHDFLHHDETEALTSAGRSVIASGTQYHVNAQQGILEDIANVHGLIEEHYDDSTLMDVTMIWRDDKYLAIRTVGGTDSSHGCTTEQLTELAEIAWEYLECQTIEQTPTIVVASNAQKTGAENDTSLEQARIDKVELPSWGTVKARVLTARL
ncbi:hypothetical protein [Pseudoclavibacter albus]|uniref:hypothetical protein n=1 Tax=Pseudoclavibacter albus TaxID=272241 RepID=UPI00135207AA|nr:hypothetical protein [Pseudoclavibacter alba]